ncbi:MAG: SUMF1/EgtB/PvdO family nonheme iron enzyme [Bacteroidota bacterium]
MVGLLLAFTAVGCGGGTDAPAGMDADTTPEPDGGAPDADEGGVTLSHCPGSADGVHGPDLTRVRWSDGIAFCIDATEVTNAQYSEFLAAKPAAGTQSARCTWNQSFTPATKSTNGPACPPFDAAARKDHPVVCVDWCDADAYCRWAGKRLCQTPGGGTVKNWTGKNASEWVIACTADAARNYPYGTAPEMGRCVDRAYPSTTPGLQPVKAAAMCEGGVPGLFDASGNAWEWQDDCAEQSTDGRGDACSPLGGSFSSETPNAACISGAPFFREQVAGDTGFRCCADALFF